MSEKNNPGESKPRITLTKSLLFYGVPLFVAALLMEILLSLVDREAVLVRTDDIDMTYRLYASQKAVSATPEFRVKVETDELGLRYCNGKRAHLPAAGYRVNLFILGDSFAEGWGVDCQASFAGVLSRELGSTYNIRNGGVHGGTPSYYVLRDRYYRTRVKPDIYVIQLFENDLDDLDKFAPFVNLTENGRIQNANPPGLFLLPSGALTRFIRKRATYRLARRLWGLIKGRGEPIKYYKPGRAGTDKILTQAQALEKFGRNAPLKDLNKDYNGQFEFYNYPDLHQIRKNPDSGEYKKTGVWPSRFNRLETYLLQLLEEARAHNPDARFVLVYIPAKEVFAPGGIRGNLRDEQNRPRQATATELKSANPFYKLLAAIARQEKLPLLDGQEFLWPDAEALYYPGDAHLNAAGHRRLADQLLKAIRAL